MNSWIDEYGNDQELKSKIRLKDGLSAIPEETEKWLDKEFLSDYILDLDNILIEKLDLNERNIPAIGDLSDWSKRKRWYPVYPNIKAIIKAGGGLFILYADSIEDLKYKIFCKGIGRCILEKAAENIKNKVIEPSGSYSEPEVDKYFCTNEESLSSNVEYVYNKKENKIDLSMGHLFILLSRKNNIVTPRYYEEKEKLLPATLSLDNELDGYRLAIIMRYVPDMRWLMLDDDVEFKIKLKQGRLW